MGYNTVAVILNDGMDQIKNDTEFGRKISAAASKVACYGDQVDIPSGNYANPASVVSVAHMDVPQVVVVKHNQGFVCKYGEAVPEHVQADLVNVLKDLGYRVSKPKAKAKALK